ncbi:MAG: fibronectin type III domain-containing protein [Thermoplasmatota archaeon]
MMLSVSMVMVFGNTGASEVLNADAWTLDGSYELLGDHSVDPFVENGGQWDESISFAAMTSFGHVAFGDGFVLFDVKGGHIVDDMKGPLSFEDASIQGTIVRMDFLGTDPIEPRGEGLFPYRTNIFHGRDPSNWGTDLATFEKVVYEDIYDGIDLIYDSTGPDMKYEFIVGPGADPSDIRFQLSGLDSLRTHDDRIEMFTPSGANLVDGGLVSFYEGSSDEIVESSFVQFNDGSVGYRIEGRDPTKALVIDPVIYSTYIGGGESEYDVDMVIDDTGACYLAGNTYSFDFPVTSGAYNTRLSGDQDGFVIKIKPDGSKPDYSTYIGGRTWDTIRSIDVDSSGNAYVAGYSDSVDFPTTKGAFNETLNGSMSDLVVFKLDPSGSRLLFSTFIGGNGSDVVENSGCIKIDDRGTIYVAGASWSSNFPLTDDAFDKYNNETTGGGPERGGYVNGKVVLVKLDPSGSRLMYSTYIGGTDWDSASGLELDQYGMVYLMGSTSSYDFPVTKGAFDTSMDSWSSIFVLKFDIGRSSLVYSTFLGGMNYQVAYDLLVDDSGRAYVVGNTGSDDFPVAEDAYQIELNGWEDIFVTAFDPTGSSLYLSTFIGGGDSENGCGIDLDPEGNILITGATWSTDYPQVVVNKDDTNDRDPDMVITKLDPMATKIIYSTVVGGNSGMGYPEDKGRIIYYSGERRVIVAGHSGSNDFPMSDNAWDNTMSDWSDIVLMDFDISLPPSAPEDFSLVRGDGFINVSWGVPLDDGGRPVLGYKIFRGLADDELKLLNTSKSELFYNDTDLEMGRTYYYMTCSFNLVGMSLPTTILSEKAACSPTPPQFFQVKNGNGWVKLSWETPVFDGAYSLEGYRLYKSADGGSPEIITLDTSKLEYYDTEVQNGVNYTYSVSTWNIIGESEHTAERWVIPKGEPTPPTGLSAVNASGSIHLTWNPPGDDGGSEILFYRVYIGIERSGQVHWRYVNAQTTEYTDSLVEIGNTYRYYVTAVNSEGESSASDVVEGQPQSEPSPPENVDISEGNGYLIVTWDAPSYLGGIELQGFRLFRSEGSGEFQMVQEFNFDEMMYKDRNVTNGVGYRYKVIAYNVFGPSEDSDEVQGTPAAVPGEPRGLEASAANGEVELTWSAPASNGGAPIIEYLIFRKTSGEDLQEIGSVPVGTLTYTDTEIEAGTTYTYAVKAGNRMGDSQFSDEVEALALGIPEAPLNVEFSTGDGFVDISWTAPASNGGSALTGYIIFRSDPELENLVIAAELGPEVTSYKDEEAQNGGSYIYTVNAVNAIGESLPAWSDVQKPLGTPGTPGSLSVSADGTIVSLTWQAPAEDGGSDIQIYRIYRLTGTISPILIGVVESGTTSFIDDGEKDDGTYTYKVVAVNAIGESKVAAEETVDVSAKDVSGGFISDNIGLVITLPIILLLLVLLVVIMVRKKGSGEAIEPVPQPAPVDQYPAEDQYADPNGYLNGYPQPEIGSAENYDPLMPAPADMEQ